MNSIKDDSFNFKENNEYASHYLNNDKDLFEIYKEKII